MASGIMGAQANNTLDGSIERECEYSPHTVLAPAGSQELKSEGQVRTQQCWCYNSVSYVSSQQLLSTYYVSDPILRVFNVYFLI